MPSASGEEPMMVDVMPNSKSTHTCEDPYLVSLVATYPARPFRLFDLPRELRDSIYDYALVDQATFNVDSKPTSLIEETAERDLTPRPEGASNENPEGSAAMLPSLQASVKARASTNVLLANKLLKQEYEGRANMATVVVLKDNDRYAFQPVTLPQQALKTQNLELHLILFCHHCPTVSHDDEKTCHAALEIEQHRIWVNKLLPELKELRSLAIHTYLCYDKFKAESKAKLPCERIIEPIFDELKRLPHVKQLTMSRYDFSANPELDGPRFIISAWPSGINTGMNIVPTREPGKDEQMVELTK